MRTERTIDARQLVSQGIRLVSAALTLAIITAACGGEDGGGSGEPTEPEPSGSVRVSMVQNGGGVYGDPITHDFSPASPTISVGDTVIWTNGTSATHTVTSDDGIWDSGDVGASSSFRMVFSESGTFRYHCIYHGAAGGAGMAGTVTVEP